MVKRIEGMSPARQKLLERLNAKANNQAKSYPLSYSQRSMWFLDQLEPNTALFNMPFARRYTGQLDVPALWRSLREIVQRHESLRTILPTRNGIAVQEVLPDLPGLEQNIDLSQLSGDERNLALKRHMGERVNESLSLSHGPLARIFLFKLADDEHVLLFNLHHIIGDGWSIYVLYSELDALYQAYTHGATTSPLAPVDLQFGDYSIWQRGWLHSGAMEQQMGFWREQLSDVAERVLPTDYPRPTVLSHLHGHHIDTTHSHDVGVRMSEFCRAESATPFMAMLAVFQLALARYLDVTDFAVGTPIANRSRIETEGIIGCLINTLALRSDINGAANFRELVRRVRARTLAAYENQDLPFEKLVEALVPTQTLRRSPMFQVMYSFENFPESKATTQHSAVSFEGVDLGPSRTRMELTLTVTEQGGMYRSTLDYDGELYNPARMQRMMAFFDRVLEAALRDPECDIWSAELLPDDECAGMIAWEQGPAAVVDVPGIGERFERRVQSQPDATALVLDTTQVSYAALNRDANRLSRYLRKQGVAAEVAVGVLLERGEHLHAALLGIIKAGGTYVPLDPGYPAERMAYMACDAGVKLLVVDEHTRHLAQAGDWLVLDLTTQRDALMQEAEDDASVKTEPDQLACVIYTSGSTGKPKGVGITYRALDNQLCWVPHTFGLTTQDRFLQKTSISFDASLGEMLAPLMAGGTVVVARPRGEYDVSYLAGLVANQAVTCVDLAPSLLQALLEYVDADAWRRVRLVVCGAEPLSLSLVHRFATCLPAATLVNAYGPTETTIQSAWSSDLHGVESVPIGRPVANTTLYVLDAHMERVPIGTRGELYIGGDGVARGYIHGTGLTAEKFVPDPFGDAGGRLYRTGDLVRWREDGQLEFLGRVDHQIKMRGYRIELGEIEHVLQHYSQVKSAAVVVREESDVQQLVAYLVASTPDARHGFEVDGLRRHLMQALPPYMIPSVFVWLDDLPLTPAGKFDRNMLPAPDDAAFSLRTYEPPQGQVEADLADLFREVLKVERIGRHDSFFELGGHSLLAVQLISRVHRAFGRDFRLVDLFTHPTIERIARALALAASSNLPSITSAERPDQLPLSFAQQGLWFLDHVDDAGRAYHMPMGARLKGPLDRSALQRALDHLVARHEVLRTTFHAADGAAVQRIEPAESSAFPLVNEQVEPLPGCEDLVQQIIREEFSARFDLGKGPLLRGRLICLGTEDHVLLITMHHIISDGWSIGIFLQELKTLYRAFHAGESSLLAPLAIQYADYAMWQRRLLSGAFLEEQQDYWRGQLADVPPLLPLPIDRPRPARQDFSGDAVGFELDAELTAALRKLSKTHHATLYMTLLAAWSLLLARLSGQSGVTIGTPCANRVRPELEELIGFFTNMLALRIEVDASATVGELLARVKATFLAAQQHEHLPFEQVVELVQPDRSVAYNPLFQVMFVWEGLSHGEGFGLPGLDAESVQPTGFRTAKFDLTLALSERELTMGGSIEFATALFDRTTIERFVGYFIGLLRGMVGNPSQCAVRLPMLPECESQRILHEWNDTALAFPRDCFAHQWIERQARRSPDAVAIRSDGGALTYAQLDMQSNRLARHLRTLGVGPEERVGLCIERGLAMIVALLAVHKAGGAYVPMDPAYPVERLRVMLDDSIPVVLLTQKHLVERFAYPGHIVDVDDAETWARQPVDPLAPADVGLRPDSLAYIIYTSGSTGTPKGVMLEHANLMHFLAWGRAAFLPQALAQTLAATSLSFDLAVFECLLPLTCGQTVHIAVDVLELAEQDFPVTLVNTVPSAMEALLDASSLPGCARIASLAGEPLKPSLVARIFERSQVDAVYNLYGPTETTTYSTVARIARGDTFSGHIGRPIANTRVYILDAHGQPVPIGVTGELHIGGAGVARGYFNRSELTAERFVNDPFTNEHGARMYRTGDFARWLANGTIEYLGRVDHQVKLRGYRIELGEIERVLESYDQVQRAVVMVREDRPGIKQLVAYVVAASDSVIDALRSHAEERLPAYMLPAVYLALPNLPMMPNGKLDHKALPVSKGTEVTSRTPRTPQERAIVALFIEVLGLTDVGVEDSFFDLGGHSLLAMRLVSQLRSKIGLEISLRTLFESSTPAALAQHASAVPDERPVLRPAALRPACVPLSYAQQRLYFLDQLEGPSATYNLPVVWRLSGKLDADAMHAAVNDLVARHESLRSINLELGGQAGQLILGVEQGRPAFIRESVEPQALQATIDRAADHRFRLQSEIPLRSWLFRVDDHDHVLLLLFHHIACDGSSMGPLLRDMSFAYAARCESRSPEWAPLAVQYPDYALWQRQWLGDETDANSVLAAQIDYWRNALQELPDSISLPVDRPRPTQATYRGDVVSADVDQATHVRLLELAQEQRVTFFMLLHAAVALLLHTLGAGDDISIGAPSAGRNDDALEPLIGFFVNMLTLRTDLSGNPTFREMLERVRAADLEAYSHADLPFDRVVEIVRPARSTSHHPLFQVMLVLNRADAESVRLHDLAVTSLDANSDTAKFDLTFHVGEKHNAQGAADGLELHLEYAVDLFERATAEAFMARLVQLFQAIAQSADSFIDDLAEGKPPASPGLNHSSASQIRPKRADLPEGVVRLKKGSDDEPFFLIHPIGGSAFCYAQLARLLMTERSVYGLETIVRDASSPFVDLASMAQAYVQRVRVLQPAGPYWLGGWSMGGLLAWEMAQQLKAQGEEVALLAMLDTFPPEVMPQIDPDRLHQHAIAKLRADLTESLVEEVPDDADGIARTLEALRVLLVDQGLVAQDKSGEEVARMLAAYEHNFWAMQHYEVKPFDQALLLFAAGAGVPDYLSSAWSDYSLGQAQCHSIAANHYTLMKADAIQAIAHELSGHLDQARSPGGLPTQGDRVASAAENLV